MILRLAMSYSANKGESPSVSRTVRFKSEELLEIEEFLSLNPMFDFSSLTRVAISRFIRDPQLTLKPLAFKERPDGTKLPPNRSS